MLRCRILLSSSMVKVIEIWKTDFQQRRTKIQFRNWPLWPWLCDLEVIRVCWPCPHLPMIWIWWRSKVIKAVLGNFRSLTLNAQYLTLGAKMRMVPKYNSLQFHYSNIKTVGGVCKGGKNAQKWQVYHPQKLNRFSDDLETYARILFFWRCIYMSDFVLLGLRESG